MAHEINPAFLDPEVQSTLRDRDQEIARLQFGLSTLLKSLREFERIFARINAETNSPVADRGLRLIHELSRTMRDSNSES